MSAVAILVLSVSARQAGAATVAVFDDPLYVSTAGGISGEADNVQASLVSLGHTVVTFTGTSAAAFSAGLAGADALLIPEQENRALGPDLNAAARNVIRDFVRGGGDLIVNGTGAGRDVQLLNLVFDLSLTSATGDASTLNAADAAGTSFAGGPGTLAANSHPFAVVGGLPRTARRIYTDALAPSGAEVAIIRFGAGNLVYLGWDWFDSNMPGCTTLCQDGGRFPACRTNHTKAAAKLHVVMSVRGQGPRTVKLTSGRQHDGPVFRVGRWVRDRLLLFDLGYFRYQLFDCIGRNGGYFISRLKENANPEITATLKQWRGRSVSLVGERLRDVIERLQREVLDVEVEVAFRRRVYAGSQSGARRSLRLVGVKDQETGRYHLYVTNIPPERLQAEQVARVYSGRWQIELV